MSELERLKATWAPQELVVGCGRNVRSAVGAGGEGFINVLNLIC